MNQDEINIRCYRCGNEYPVMQMVMDSSGKGMACGKCAGVSLDSPKMRPGSGVKAGKQRPYTCAECKFKFKSTKPLKSMICGYCGGSNILTEKESSADALIEEASRKRFTDE